MKYETSPLRVEKESYFVNVNMQNTQVWCEQVEFF